MNTMGAECLTVAPRDVYASGPATTESRDPGWQCAKDEQHSQGAELPPVHNPKNKPIGASVLNLIAELLGAGNWLSPTVRPFAGQVLRQAKIVPLLILGGSECFEAS